jgi:hypothetical protein
MPTVSSISDGSNSYSKAAAIHEDDSAANRHSDHEIWYVANAASLPSSSTITVTIPAASQRVLSAINGVQVSGILTSSPYDTAGATNSDGGTLPSSPTVTTGTLAQANTIVFGANANDMPSVGGTFTEDASFTNLFNNNSEPFGSWAISLGYRIVGSTAAVTHNPSLSATGSWLEIAAPFKQLVTYFGMPRRNIIQRRY